MNSQDILEKIANEVAACQKCGLHHSRKRAVPGEGPAQSEIMFIGEGPGFYENEQGRPFVGQAGKFLDELLQHGGVNREQVFIANVVKCRPPGNRDPQPDELAACGLFLDQQIEAIHPRIIVTLGRFSMARYLPNVKISEAHGQATWIRGRLIVPMYHPAAALHQPSLKSTLIKDFSHLPDYIRQAREKTTLAVKAGIDEGSTSAAILPPGNDHAPEQLSILGALKEAGLPASATAPVEEPPTGEKIRQLNLF